MNDTMSDNICSHSAYEACEFDEGDEAYKISCNM